MSTARRGLRQCQLLRRIRAQAQRCLAASWTSSQQPRSPFEPRQCKRTCTVGQCHTQYILARCCPPHALSDACPQRVPRTGAHSKIKLNTLNPQRKRPAKQPAHKRTPPHVLLRR
eukprot:7387731-Alexandrium_andersonii.AAC.1